MANLTISVPTAAVPRVLAAFRAMYPDIASGTDAQVGRQGIIRVVRQAVLAYESQKFDLTATTDKDTTINAVITELSGMS